MSASYLVRLLGSELRLMLGRRRNQLGLAGLALVPLVMGIAIRVSGDSPGGSLGGVSNGTLVPMLALVAESAFFLPLAIAMLAGDSIAGEAGSGTLRYLLVAPVRRGTLIAVKFASLVIGALLGTLVVAGVGLVVGTILFGTGPGLSLSGTALPYGLGVARLLVMVGYVAAIISAYAAIGLFFSTLVDHAMAVTVGLMFVVILSWILQGVNQLDWLHPWLLTQWSTSFLDLLREPPMLSDLGHGLALAGGYAAVFLAAAWARFAAKDIGS